VEEEAKEVLRVAFEEHMTLFAALPNAKVRSKFLSTKTNVGVLRQLVSHLGGDIKGKLKEVLLQDLLTLLPQAYTTMLLDPPPQEAPQPEATTVTPQAGDQ
jgi:hypothetical protein